MVFLKKFIMGFAALSLILLGGAGTQSPSLLFQGVGFIGLIIGLIVLYIFTKMAWRAMGCLPSFLAVGGIIVFILYAIGAFNNGVSGFGQTIKSFMGQSSGGGRSQMTNASSPLLVEETVVISETFSSSDNAPQEQAPAPQDSQEKDGGIFSGFFKKEAPAAFDPSKLPAVYGPVRVINGDTLQIQGYYFRLFGVDAPEPNQTCADRMGRSYNCGAKASSWLRAWLMDNEVECKIMQRDNEGNMVGICFLGQYDIGAALVNAGWAVAYPKHTDIYYPYQEQAKAAGHGLWQGKFYMPWDWRTIQSKKPKIKIVKPKTSKKTILDVGYGQ